jgi:hypothetical protein
MADELFTARARAYEIKYGKEAHQRLGISRSRFKRYTEGGTTKDKNLRAKIMRRGLTAQKRQIYEGAFRQLEATFEKIAKDPPNQATKEFAEKKLTQIRKEYRSGTWQTQLKEANAKVSSRNPYAYKEAGAQYDIILQGGGGPNVPFNP